MDMKRTIRKCLVTDLITVGARINVVQGMAKDSRPHANKPSWAPHLVLGKLGFHLRQSLACEPTDQKGPQGNLCL